MTKILAVLQWWYLEIGRDRNPMDILRAVGPLLGKGGGEIDLEPITPSVRRQRKKKEAAWERTKAGKILSAAAQKSRLSKGKAVKK
jgi:hypothetical protein